MALQLFKIASTTVESQVSSITFSSIPSGYTDLQIAVSSRSANGSNLDNPRISFNGSTTSFSRRSLYGESSLTGSEAFSDRIIGVTPANNATSNTFGSLDLYIPNYTGSANKSYRVDSVTENNLSPYSLWLLAGLWSSTSSITEIVLSLQSGGNFATNTTATLYGVL